MIHLCHQQKIMRLPSAGGARAGTEHSTSGVPDLLVGFPLTVQWGQSTASSLAVLSGMMTPFVLTWRASAQHVLLLQVMPLSWAGTATASSCQPLPPPPRPQPLRGFHELKYLAYQWKMFLFPTAELCSSLSSKRSLCLLIEFCHLSCYKDLT